MLEGDLGSDLRALAAAVVTALFDPAIGLGERLYYLAATGIPPFDDQATLVSTLLRIWISALYET